MTEFGLKGTHVMCLFFLHHTPEGLTAAQLCQLCAEDKAAISRTIATLKEKGYIVENLRINMDISDNDSIVINSIVYKPENSLESEKIKQELYEWTLCKNIQEENHERNKS